MTKRMLTRNEPRPASRCRLARGADTATTHRGRPRQETAVPFTGSSGRDPAGGVR